MEEQIGAGPSGGEKHAASLWTGMEQIGAMALSDDDASSRGARGGGAGNGERGKLPEHAEDDEGVDKDDDGSLFGESDASDGGYVPMQPFTEPAPSEASPSSARLHSNATRNAPQQQLYRSQAGGLSSGASQPGRVWTLTSFPYDCLEALEALARHGSSNEDSRGPRAESEQRQQQQQQQQQQRQQQQQQPMRLDSIRRLSDSGLPPHRGDSATASQKLRRRSAPLPKGHAEGSAAREALNRQASEAMSLRDLDLPDSDIDSIDSVASEGDGMHVGPGMLDPKAQIQKSLGEFPPQNDVFALKSLGPMLLANLGKQQSLLSSTLGIGLTLHHAVERLRQEAGHIPRSRAGTAVGRSSDGDGSHAFDVENIANMATSSMRRPDDDHHRLKAFHKLLSKLYVSWQSVRKEGGPLAEKVDSQSSPPETHSLRKHIRDYFDHKYGNASLVEKAERSFYRHMSMFRDDSRVFIFQHVLDHRIDAAFGLSSFSTRRVAANLLRKQLQEKYPDCTATQLQQSLQTRLRGKLLRDEWVTLVGQFLHPRDAGLAIAAVHYVQEILYQEEPSHRGRVGKTLSSSGPGKGQPFTPPPPLMSRKREAEAPDEAIEFETLMEIIQILLLRHRMEELAPLSQGFRRATSTRQDGLLNLTEAEAVCQRVASCLLLPTLPRQLIVSAVRKYLVERLLLKGNSQSGMSFNFSDCVECFGKLRKIMTTQT